MTMTRTVLTNEDVTALYGATLLARCREGADPPSPLARLPIVELIDQRAGESSGAELLMVLMIMMTVEPCCVALPMSQNYFTDGVAERHERAQS
jgi:hypothetical protein